MNQDELLFFFKNYFKTSISSIASENSLTFFILRRSKIEYWQIFNCSINFGGIYSKKKKKMLNAGKSISRAYCADFQNSLSYQWIDLYMIQTFKLPCSTWNVRVTFSSRTVVSCSEKSCFAGVTAHLIQVYDGRIYDGGDNKLVVVALAVLENGPPKWTEKITKFDVDGHWTIGSLHIRIYKAHYIIFIYVHIKRGQRVRMGSQSSFF